MFFTELHCNYHHSDRYDCWYGRGGGWSTCKLRSTQQYIHGFVNTFDNFDFYCLQNNFMFTKKYEIDKSMFVMKLQMTCRLNDEMNVLM